MGNVDPQAGSSRRPRAAPFRDLAVHLRAELAAGRWSVGSRLPTASELASTHGVGVNTVRRAMEELVGEGLIRTKRGSGARVVALPSPTAPSRAVGLIVPMNRHYETVVDNVEHALRGAGFNLWLSCTDYDPAAELAQARSFVADGVEGLIVVPTVHLGTDPSGHLDSFANLGVPYIFAERRPVAPAPTALARRASYVCSDMDEGLSAAIQHLKQLGRTRIGYHGLPGTPHSAEVLGGYQRALVEHELPFIESAMMQREPWSELDMEDFTSLVVEHELDAVFCSSDRNAAFLLSYLREAGVRVPGQVAVVTFNDTVADMAEVPLTTVAPARDEVGALAAQTLVRAIEARDEGTVIRTLVSPRLIRRASTSTPGWEAPDRASLSSHAVEQ